MDLFVVLISYVITGVIFGFITKYIANSKGYDGGFAWGFWLGIIGILVVGFRPNQTATTTTYQSRYSSDSYQMSSTRENSGYAPKPTGWMCICGSKNPSSIDYCMSCRRSREEATEGRIKCPHCGANNKKTNANCFACGKSMDEKVQVTVPEKATAPVVVESNDFADKLKKLAELHEQGVLTDEEFTQKKADILAKM